MEGRVAEWRLKEEGRSSSREGGRKEERRSSRYEGKRREGGSLSPFCKYER